MLKNLIMLIFVGLFSVACARAQKSNDDAAAKIYGDWTGESICADKQKFPACKDEKVVYHFSKSSEAGKIHLAADKIVNGANEAMGEFDFVYDAAAGTLICEFTFNKNHGIWEFQVNGDVIEGTLKTLPEKTLVRNVKVKKSK